jgi:hypothetical protein
MSIRFGIALALGLLLLGVGGSASAEQKKLIGNITSIDVSASTFDVAESSGSREMTFTVGNKARITDGRKVLKLADLQSGQSVSVTYADEDGTRVVQHMQVTPSMHGPN